MPLPLVPVFAAIVAATVGGGAVATGGGMKMRRAKVICRDAAAAHGKALEEFRLVESRVQADAGAYGRRQLRVQATTLAAWVAWLEKNEKKVRLIGRQSVDGVDIDPPDIPKLKAQAVESVGLLSGGLTAAGGAYVAYQAALWGVTSFAAAGTGTAISSLSGAAATNATLAWLGGGTLAAGGGGVALGSIMLTAIAAAPAALIGGFAVGVQGQRALTKARQVEADVEIAMAEMDQKAAVLERVSVRIGELEDVLDKVNARAMAALAFLSELDFDPRSHLGEFQRTALMMRALGEILSTPIVDATGEPTEESLRVKERYSHE